MKKKKKKPSGTGTKSGHKNAPADDSQKLPTEIQLLRTHVATSEAALKEAKELAGQAKQRRKLAKLLAKKTRQDAQRAKTDLAKVRKTLARAEAALKSDAKAKKRAPKAVIPSVSKPAEKLSAAPRKP